MTIDKDGVAYALGQLVAALRRPGNKCLTVEERHCSLNYTIPEVLEEVASRLAVPSPGSARTLADATTKIGSRGRTAEGVETRQIAFIKQLALSMVKQSSTSGSEFDVGYRTAAQSLYDAIVKREEIDSEVASIRAMTSPEALEEGR
jgi:hypothetical protein